MRILTLICVVLLFGVSWGGQAYAQSNATKDDLIREVTVEGTCERMITPDRARITLVARSLKPEIAAAVKEANDKYETVRAEVRRLNLKDLELETAQYHVYEEREWQERREVSKGYRAEIGLRVATSELDKLGEVMALAAKRGLEAQSGLEHYVSVPLRRKVEMECLQDAAQHARQKAEKIAQTLGASVGQVLNVSQGGGIMPMPPVAYRGGAKMAMMAEAASDMAAPVIEAGQTQITLSLSVRFALR